MEMTLHPYVWLFPLFAFLIHWIRRQSKSPFSRLPLPPGPKPLPILGNLLDMPSQFIWEIYDKWYKEFGSDIVYVDVAGTPILIVNTYKTAIELFEKRSLYYSSRIVSPMVGELMGYKDWSFVSMPNDDKWRSYRRLFHQTFNAKASKQFEPQQLKAVHQFLLRLIERPGSDNLMEQIKYLTGSVIMDIVYGIKMLPDDDPYASLLEKQNVVVAAVPGKFWVNFLPWLKYVPKWFPGATFRHQADMWAGYAMEMIEKPFEATKRNINEGHFTPSFTSHNLHRLQSGSSLYYDEKAVRDVAGVAYGAGSDTTATAIATFALAMLQYPEIQKRAQAELDDILHGSLPTLNDQEALPYVTAVVFETLRWKPVTPFAIPHRLVSDDIYNGYRLPSGSMVIPNCWSMLYDEDMYHNPDTFNPDRFLKDGKLNHEVRDPRLIVFGFGRRICPGRYMGYSSLWITVASILATTNITKVLDKNGKVIEPSGEYASALIYCPKPFPCNVVPRSKNAEALIRAATLSEE